jgi:predicted nucleotide-binding protein
MIKEIQILSEGLWESVKTDLKFFSPIQLFSKKLAEIDFTEKGAQKEALLYWSKIEDYFEKYRRKPNTTVWYSEPHLIGTNNDSVIRIGILLNQLNTLNEEQLESEINNIRPKKVSKSEGKGYIFIGHGRNKIWARLQIFLKDDLNLKTLTFEDESRTSETIINILDEFLDKTSVAILIMTAEDDTADGKIRARQNVIHEAGLFQGRLGFDKVIILKQEGIEEFSNIAGLQYIPFSKDNIEQSFYELQRKFKKLGITK